ncbi:uncharacterized protein LOC125179271 [Hyalella azteca]|uniref:Uncharacterized protein LOC125179271 n=1 Tax=Hyalella azteca TaxID=294128 RepID=A0A979FWS6_HYAAZ|nr:uncharacterized protein LOC125179271 [Hyalella azteca]
MLSTSTKHSISTHHAGYVQRMELLIHELAPADVGAYTCVARNSMGEVASTVSVYYTPPLTTPRPPAPHSSQHRPRRPTKAPDDQDSWLPEAGNYQPIDANDDTHLVPRGTPEGKHVHGSREDYSQPTNSPEKNNLQIFVGFGRNGATIYHKNNNVFFMNLVIIIMNSIFSQTRTDSLIFSLFSIRFLRT